MKRKEKASLKWNLLNILFQMRENWEALQIV